MSEYILDEDEVELETGEEYDESELAELLDGLISSKKQSVIELDMEDYALDEFSRGVENMSYTCGTISALQHIGLSEDFILEYLLSKDALVANVEINESNNATQIEVANKYSVVMEKQEI